MEVTSPVPERTALAIADQALAARALVYGSLPPAGRDLDLLVRRDERRALGDALASAGFLQCDDVWARFAGCSVDVVDVAIAEAWGLPPEELDALFAEGRLLDGLTRLVRPAPHHALLILARRAAADGGALDAKRRARLDQALAEDPRAWSLARARAGAWGVAEVVERLEAAPRPPDRRPPGARAGGRAGP
jgi:hypothetical protein